MHLDFAASPVFARENTKIPKIIWMLWLQGFANAPEIVRISQENWQRMNPDYKVQSLDATTVANFIPAAECAQFFNTAKPPEAISNQIRLALLHHHGGVWADVTTLCATPLDQWLAPHAPSGFFAFANPGPDRMLSTWFLAASKANPAVTAWRRAMAEYWNGRLERHTYFWVHHLFAEAYAANPEIRQTWDETVKISAQHPFHFGPNHPALYAPQTPAYAQALQNPPVPVFKLTHKMDPWPAQNSLLHDLLRYGQDIQPARA